jgi:hypothetical protein
MTPPRCAPRTEHPRGPVRPRPGPAPSCAHLIPDWHTARPWHRWPLRHRRPPLVDARARAGHAQHVDGRRDRNGARPLRGHRRLRREVPAGDGPLASSSAPHRVWSAPTSSSTRLTRSRPDDDGRRDRGASHNRGASTSGSTSRTPAWRRAPAGPGSSARPCAAGACGRPGWRRGCSDVHVTVIVITRRAGSLAAESTDTRPLPALKWFPGWQPISAPPRRTSMPQHARIPLPARRRTVRCCVHDERGAPPRRAGQGRRCPGGERAHAR